jgi:putative (di)nucleoside polyphosphate hydrolase
MAKGGDAYRPGVGLMLIARDGRVFIAQRLDTPGQAWQMPQGGIDAGEKPRAAALRELREETGVARAKILAESADWHRYDLPAEVRAKLWGGRFRGQRQKWFALAFDGDDDEIDIATETPEFSAWRWEWPERVCDLIVPFKVDLYRAVFAEFAPILAARRGG